jgi:hypothetical protein
MQFIAGAVPLIGVAAFKFYQNTFPEERTEGVHQVRQNTLAERYMHGGEDSRIARMDDKKFEKFVRTNSVGKSCEEKFRNHRTMSQGGAKVELKVPEQAAKVPEQAVGA